jgi:hypothetical protein
MDRLKVGRSKGKDDRRKSKERCVYAVEQPDAQVSAEQDRRFEFFVVVVLLVFGAYHSILYFGQKVVPTPDFPSFVGIGHELLSFKVPSSFKQAPVYCFLLACLSHVVGGQYPDLRAGWLLNAIWHPFSLVLFWAVAKRVVGKSALWFAVIAILSPWVMRMLTDPIVETTLLFFILLTFYFIFKRSNWSYLFASITTVVRYEGAALIMVAFVMDLISSTSRREKIRAFAYSVIASVPLAIWLLGTVLTWSSTSSSHYLTLFGPQSYYAKALSTPYESNVGFILNMKVLWQTGFYPLLMPYPAADEGFVSSLWGLSKTVAVAGFLFGAIYGLFKRNWNILAMLCFFVPYFCVHSRIPAPLMRYHMPIAWIAMLICWFGLQSTWQIINKNQRVPLAVVTALQILILAVAGIWLFSLLPYLPAISAMSPKSASVPYVTVGLAGLLLGVRAFVFRSKYLPQNPVSPVRDAARYVLQQVVVLMVLALVVVSNQFALVRTLGDGQTDKEFVELAQWYSKNAQPGERLVVYMAGTVKMFLSKDAEYILDFPKADSPAKLVEACQKENITYVVWAAREGLSKDHPGYRDAGLDKNLALLEKPRSIGPYEFVVQLGSNRGYVNVFRLHKPPEPVAPKPPAE